MKKILILAFAGVFFVSLNMSAQNDLGKTGVDVGAPWASPLLPKNHLNPMFRIGRSVLTACELGFATESVALFFDETQYPVSISMKLTFMEVEVMTRQKVEKGF